MGVIYIYSESMRCEEGNEAVEGWMEKGPAKVGQV